jgi:hypothetical protein
VVAEHLLAQMVLLLSVVPQQAHVVLLLENKIQFNWAITSIPVGNDLWPNFHKA